MWSETHTQFLLMKLKDMYVLDDAEDARFWTPKNMEASIEEMESRKILDAAEKAIKLVKDSN